MITDSDSKTIDFLFDIGNVIVHVDFISSLQKLIPEGVDQPEARLNRLLERKDEFEAGRLSHEDYFPWAARTIGYEGELEQFMDAWVDIFSPNEVMWNTIESLYNAGHRLILFSNINEPHIHFLQSQHPIFKCFKGGIFSYRTGHIKPEDEIYQLAIKDYELVPERTAYIDDLPANIEGGKRAGLICHQYSADRHDEFLNWLSNIT
ncbi:MAG: HAD family hydrolase [Akkermansiaceae bacterium]